MVRLLFRRDERAPPGSTRLLTFARLGWAAVEEAVGAIGLVERQEDRAVERGADLAAAVAREQGARECAVNVGEAGLHAEGVLGANRVARDDLDHRRQLA